MQILSRCFLRALKIFYFIEHNEKRELSYLCYWRLTNDNKALLSAIFFMMLWVYDSFALERARASPPRTIPISPNTRATMAPAFPEPVPKLAV